MQTIRIPCTRWRDMRDIRTTLERTCAPGWVTYFDQKVSRHYNDGSQEPAIEITWEFDEADLDDLGYPTRVALAAMPRCPHCLCVEGHLANCIMLTLGARLALADA